MRHGRSCQGLVAGGVLGLALAAQDAAAALVGNAVDASGRSGTVGLRLDDDQLRGYGFTTADYGLALHKGNLVNHNAQLLAVTGPAGDEFHVDWQAGEGAALLDVGPWRDRLGRSQAARITAAEVQQRFACNKASRRLPIVACHVYLLRILRPCEGHRAVLPGEPLHVRFEVLQHDPGRSLQIAWAILDAPVAPGHAPTRAFDPRMLPPLPRPDAVTERQWTEFGRLAEALADGFVAGTVLEEDGFLLLRAAANRLREFDGGDPGQIEQAKRLIANLGRTLGATTPGTNSSAALPVTPQDLHGRRVAAVYAVARRFPDLAAWRRHLQSIPSARNAMQFSISR